MGYISSMNDFVWIELGDKNEKQIFFFKFKHSSYQFELKMILTKFV